jgi:hypothetical protein
MSSTNARQQILPPTQNYERDKALPTHVPATLALWRTQLYPSSLILTTSCRLIFVVDPLTVLPSTTEFHNLCRNPTDVSPDVLDALGLGLGFGLSLKRKDENPIDFDRLRKDLCTRYFFRNTPPPRKLNFPKLSCVKSPDWVPDDAHKKIELALTAF